MKRKKYKFLYGLIISVCLIFIVVNSKDRESQISNIIAETDAPDKEVFVGEMNEQDELHIETYKDLELEKEQKKVTQSKKEDERTNDRKEASGTKENRTRIVIDESKETMRDETEGTEDEYIAQNEPNGKVDLHEPKEIEGEDTTVDTKPGGKRNIGTWG